MDTQDGDAAIWVDEAIVEIRDGIGYGHVRSNGKWIELRASVATVATTLAGMQTAYASHLAHPGAQVVSIVPGGTLARGAPV